MPLQAAEMHAHDEQKVVQVMRYPAGQVTDQLHFLRGRCQCLRFHQLLLQALDFRFHALFIQHEGMNIDAAGEPVANAAIGCSHRFCDDHEPFVCAAMAA